MAVLAQARKTANVSLSEVQWSAIQYIKHHPDAPLFQLAAGLQISSPAATKLVDRLVERDWVAREQHPLDRRKWVLRLTDRGSALYDSVREAEAERFTQVLNAMSAEDRSALIQGLKGFVSAVQEQWDLDGICLECGTEMKDYCILGIC